MIAALYVETGGCYFGRDDVDPWDINRDARLYSGPHPVVAHPPCQRWGRFWHGSTRKPHQFEKGADGGCFEAAYNAINRYGGVIEHPADSHAWAHMGIPKPPRDGGWLQVPSRMWHALMFTCCVYQGHYGHFAGKPTWLLTSRLLREQLPELRWGKVEQRLHPTALAKHGYEKARRIGMMAMIGGKDKTRIRNATPPEFRDVLLSIAGQTTPGARHEHDLRMLSLRQAGPVHQLSTARVGAGVLLALPSAQGLLSPLPSLSTGED